MKINTVDTVNKLLPTPAQIVDDIRNLTNEDYQLAIDQYLNSITNHSGVYFVGQFGTVNTPGVSDIDLLVITKNEDYKSVSEMSRHIIQELPNGEYLFWHPAVILPLSLVPASCVLHSFDNLRALWGDASILEQMAKPPFPLSAINTIIWNTYFWRIAVSLRFGQQGLRKLLLILGNIVQSIASDYHLLGLITKSQNILEWKNEVRGIILTAPAEQRPDIMVHYLSKALLKWLETDWMVQEWWVNNVQGELKIDGIELPLGHGVIVEFKQKKVTTDNYMSPFRYVKKHLWPFNRTIYLVLPQVYIEVIHLVKSAFTPRSNNLHFEETTKISKLDTTWMEAIIAYKKAVTNTRNFSLHHDKNDLEMFTHPFCLPFGNMTKLLK